MLTLAKVTDKKWKELAPRLPRKFAHADVSAAFAKLGEGVARAAGTGWAAIVNDAFVFMGAGETAPRTADLPPAKALRLHDVSPDGTRAVVAAREDVHEIDLATLRSRVVFRLPDGAFASSIVYLAGDRAAIAHGDVLVLAATGETWRELSSTKQDGARELTAVRGGAILITTPSGTYGGRPPIACAIEGDALREVGRTDNLTYFKAGADEIDGRVFVTDSKWKRHELLGLPDTPKEARAETTPDDFVFYGESPSDWYEGANLGHPYELVFRKTPDASTKNKIAKLFTKATRKGPIEASPSPWMWSGRFALFFVGERGAGGDRFFGAVRALTGEIHAIAPLDEVVFRGARAESTTYPRPPTPGPRYPSLELPATFGSKHDDALPIAAADPAFEKARA